MSTYNKNEPTVYGGYNEADENRLKCLRIFGLLSSYVSLFTTALVVGNKNWTLWVDTDHTTGLWDSCVYIGNNTDIISHCREGLSSCQWTSICLMLISLILSILASSLATVGGFVLALPWKLYYYHSSAEVFFCCGIFALGSSVMQGSCVKSSQQRSLTILQQLISQDNSSYWSLQTRVGYATYLGISAAVLFFISSFCMSFDEIVLAIKQWLLGSKEPQEHHHVQQARKSMVLEGSFV